MKPSHKQISFLSNMLAGDKILQRHFDMERTADRLNNIRTYNLYRYILYLYINRHQTNLYIILERLGFKAKEV